MNQPQFVIRHVAALAPGRLGLQFGDGLDAVVDLSEVINKHPSLARLADPGVFRARPTSLEPADAYWRPTGAASGPFRRRSDWR